MKKIPLLVLVVLTLGAMPAEAHHSSTSRIHNMRHVAQSVWGETCNGTMNVPIVSKQGPLRDHETGEAHPEWVASFFGLDFDSQQPLQSCVIELDRDKAKGMSSEYLCRVIVHEFGHARRLAHSTNPRSIMWSGRLDYFGPCAIFRR